MNLQEENPTEIMKRFMWIDDDTIRLISREGIEAIIDMRRGFKEISYNMIPMFNMEEIADPLQSYYTNRKPLEISEVKDRLIRKYQAYKSAYYLQKKREP